MTLAAYLAPSDELKLIAHRGLSARCPENTLPAFEAALDASPDLIELDVTLSADGHPVVIHDETLDRTTDGGGPVSARTLVELRALDAGGWFDPAFAGARIPRLEEVLELADGRAPINVELKAEAGVPLVAPVIAAIEDRRAGADVILSCFDPALLRAARDAAPALARSSLYSRRHHAGLPVAELLEEVDSVQLSPSRREVSAGMVAAARAAGRPVAVYTVNDAREARRLREIGVHAVFTDDVAALRRGLADA